MLAPFNRLSLVTVSPLLMLAIGCDSEGTTRSATVAASVTVDTTHPAPANASKVETNPVATTSASYTDGEAAYQAGRYAEAADVFAAYTERKPDNPWGFYMLGLSSWKAGNPAQADVAFDEALKLDPKHQKSLLNSARVLLELGRADEALSRVETALALDSTSAETWRVLGRTKVELDSTDEAVEAYRHAITLDDHDVWAMNNLGLIYIQKGTPTEALGPLARATQIKPGAPLFQNNLGQALEASGYPTAAQRAYQAALDADSTYQKAALALERVAGRGPDSTTAEVDVASLARQFEASIEQWRDALAGQGQAEHTGETAGAATPEGMARDSTPEVVSRPESQH